MSNEEYYAEVENIVGEVIIAVGRQSLQPKEGPTKLRNGKWDKQSGAVYITSVKNRESREHKEGVVTLVPYYAAAKGIMDNLHKVSTDEEIKKFLAEQKVKRDEILSAGARARNVQQFNVVPPVLEVSK